jgi:DNA-binding transcriptional LysR family regulator
LFHDMDELEAAVRQQQATPQGQLMVAAPTTFCEMHLTRAVADYLTEQPGVSVELVLADRFVNIVDEGFDLAVRIGRLADSGFIARRLAPMRVALSASPEYLKCAGVPAHPQELASLPCVIDTNIQDPEPWTFREHGRSFRVSVNGRFRANSALAVREILLSEQGLGLCPFYVIEKDVRTGRLRILLEEHEAGEYGIYSVYPHNRYLAAKVRTFVDFLVGWFNTPPA